MPVYSYKCKDCGADSDIRATVEEKMAGKPERFSCSACGSANVKQEFNLNTLIKKADCSSGDACCGGQGAGGGCSC